MNKQQAREAITRWAKSYYAINNGDLVPEVEAVAMSYDQGGDEWTAELSVSFFADNPHVTFWFDEVHQLEENRLNVATIEY